MAAVLIPVLIVLAVAVVAVAAFVTVTRRQNRQVEEAESEDTGRLRYLVPKGQDTAAIIAALQREGYDAVNEGEFIVVPFRVDPDRERAHVRSVIAGADATIEGDPWLEDQVRFTDER